MTTAFSLCGLLSGLSALAFTSPESISWKTVEAALFPVPTIATEDVLSDSQPSALTSPDGEIVGEVIDFIFDLRGNHTLYSVGVFHSPEEFADRVFILPWRVAQVDSDTNSFTLQGGKATLQKAPSFPLDAWLNLSPTQWTAAINAAWKEKESANLSATSTSDQVLSRASDLIGKAVKTTTGEDVGALAELLVDPEEGAIAYAIVSFNYSGKNSRTLFYPLPWTTVQADPVQLTFVVPDFVKEKLYDPPLFQADRKPRLQASVWGERTFMAS